LDRFLGVRDIGNHPPRAVFMRGSRVLQGRLGSWIESGVWQFLFDTSNNNLSDDPKGTPFAARRVSWQWRFSLSDRGPLVTCQSYSLVFQAINTNLDCAYRLDVSARAMAVEWSRRIAGELELHYVDAKMLRDWPVSYEDIDPDFDLEHDVHTVPNAFQVLFYE
jgi:hypothetical protein